MTLQKKHISTSIKNPKTICAIIAAISVGVLLVFLMPSLWFWISWEVTGGILVAIGCIGEWRLIVEWPDKVRGAAHHVREVHFVTAVAIGVTMEVIGLAHSIPEALRLEKNVAQLTQTNLQLTLQIESLRATNQPVFDISAFVEIKVAGSNHVEIPHWGSAPIAYLMLCPTPFHAAFGAGILPNLESERFKRSFSLIPEDARQYSMNFQLDPVAAAFFRDLGRAKSLQDINALSILVKFIPLDADIMGGSAKVIINSSIIKDFDIPPQKAFEPLVLTNNPEYRDAFQLIAVFGTNTLPINRGPRRR